MCSKKQWKAHTAFCQSLSGLDVSGEPARSGLLEAEMVSFGFHASNAYSWRLFESLSWGTCTNKYTRKSSPSFNWLNIGLSLGAIYDIQFAKIRTRTLVR